MLVLLSLNVSAGGLPVYSVELAASTGFITNASASTVVKVQVVSFVIPPKKFGGGGQILDRIGADPHGILGETLEPGGWRLDGQVGSACGHPCVW